MKRAMKTMDGNHAAAHASYAFSEVAAIYPITPSSAMAEVTDEWAVKGRKNIFGQTVKVTQMQSEAGAAGTVHGALAAGALTTTFTASQGLLLMIPNLYKIAGEQLPGVFNVAARAIATHALSIFGDHSDIYACRQSGVAMLATSSVQEVMDLTPVAHCAAIKGKLPFINFFDGFRTSHEMQKIEVWDYEDLKSMVDFQAISEFKKNALNPNHPKQMGAAQNPDIFFQLREASNENYSRIPNVVKHYMDEVNTKLGTNYGLFDYYGCENPEHVIIAMGSVCETIEETITYINAGGGHAGLVKVHLYRPFCNEALVSAIPDSVQKITVLDRTKEPGSAGEPLYLDVIAALRNTRFHNTTVFRGRYGLGSKDTTPAQIYSVFHNMEKPVFTIGITDDVTNLSLAPAEDIDTAPKDMISCKFWGLGADGTVGANKNSIMIIGDNTDQYVQAYFDYDSKKSGGVTVSHLRFGHSPIKSTYLINKADFVACHNPSYILKYNMVQDLKKGGTFLLNTSYNAEELESHLPGHIKRFIAEHNIKFYTIDGIRIGKEIGLGGRINTILQSAFFKLADIIPEDQVIDLMKKAASASYGKKGEKTVHMNHEAIERGVTDLVAIEVPPEWKNARDDREVKEGNVLTSDSASHGGISEFVEEILKPMNALEGNKLPVSVFMKYQEGSTPSGTAAYEKRGIAVDIPVWDPENCIQCNRCSFVCPHAAIRPIVLNDEEVEKAPKGMKFMEMTGVPGMHFGISVSVLDCAGCATCATVCPGKKEVKALTMKNMRKRVKEQEFFDYGRKLSVKEQVFERFAETTVKGCQFKQPLLEFSGACAGCGETPYAKLATQLFGERMYIANATGCSSIWGNSSPSTPYTVNANGKGPAWSNSLFEDAAEFGFGMELAQKAIREELYEKVKFLITDTNDEALRAAATEWMDTFRDGTRNGEKTALLIQALEESSYEAKKDILEKKDFLAKKSQWIFGGDGWAYDIGFGGLDHVLASGHNVNMLVFDTEVYSNTGGQASKATPLGAVAQFAAGGKAVQKKDLAGIAMTYGNVYVAQVAMGADYNQCVKAFTEAEQYDGPSLIIAYAPCISHGIKTGMNTTQFEEKRAVESGYWHCFRFNPDLMKEGKPAFILDSKEPDMTYEDYLMGEVRYSTLMQSNPEHARELFQMAAESAKYRYEYLKKLVTLYE